MALGLLLTEYFCKQNKKQEDYENRDISTSTLIMAMMIRFILALPMMLIAGILAWRCNSAEPAILRILYTFLAKMFSSVYIFYYLVYRIVLKNPCKK